MTLANLSWRRWLNSLAQLVPDYARPPHGKRRRRPRSRLVLESLEDRIAPTASLLKDIGVALGNPTPAHITAVGSTVYFSASDAVNSGLGKWDGTNFTLIKLNGNSPYGSTPYDLTALGSNLYFGANDGTGDKLYKYDGSNLSKINVGTINNPAPNYLTVVGSNLYFSASDGTGTQLWKYDGSNLSEIKVGTASNPGTYGLTAVGSNLYFGASDGAGNQLWKYDGSNVSEIKVGTYANPNPGVVTAVGSKLYFSASDGTGTQLWKYDGSNVSEIKVGTAANPQPQYLTAVGSTLYFNANDGTGNQLWKYDGSNLSEIKVGTATSPSPNDLTAMGNTLYFAAGISSSNGPSIQLWKYDGTNLSMIPVGPSPNPYPNDLTVMGSNLYFNAADATGYQLWKYDGSNASEIKISNYTNADPSNLTVVGNLLYFGATDHTNSQLWSYDTSSGTMQQEVLYTTLASSSPTDFVQMGNKVYFSADDGLAGQELWVTDGTTNGTSRISDINPGTASSSPQDLTVVGSTLYFFAYDGTGTQLWKYDGSNLSEIKIGTYASPNAAFLTAVGNTVFFRAYDGTGYQLWKYDGSNLSEIKVGASANAYPQDLIAVGSTLYFVASDGTTSALWKYDGSNLTEIKVGPSTFANPSGLTAMGSNVYFNAYDGTGYELWKYDGANLSEIPVGTYAGASPDHLTVVGSILYFRAYNGTNYQVWKYGGSNMSVIATLNPDELTSVGSTLYFSASDGTGVQLWKYDGSTLSEIKVGTSANSSPAYLTPVGNILYFNANDGVNNQLWEYDGTNLTEISINPSGAANPNSLSAIGNALYLNANDGSHGQEPWTVTQLVAAYNFAQGSGNLLSDLSGNGNNGTISNAAWTTVSNGSLPFTGALQFAGGNNSLVTIANSASLDLTTGMTLEAWVDPTAAVNSWQDAIYKARDNYYLEASSTRSGAPAAGGIAGPTDTTLFGSAALPTNTWNFLTVTYDGTSMIFYVNGVQVASKSLSGNLATSTNPVQIGGDSTYGQYFQGLISNVRIYNVALTATQIQSDMTTPIATDAPPTVTSVTPANNASNVSIGTAVTVQFNEPLDPATVTSSTIQLLNSSGSAVAATVAYNTSTDSATLTPSAALSLSSTYTVLVHGSSSGAVIKDANDTPLAANFSSSFTTAATQMGLVAAYNFAQGSGNVLTDDSGNGNNGTISNATWTTVNNNSLPFTGALQFAGGNNSLVTIANSASLDLTIGMTLEAWVDPTAAVNSWQDAIYKARDNYYLEASSTRSGTPAAGGIAGPTDTTLFGSTALPTNAWSFLSATYDGTSMIFYVNGVQVASKALSGNLATSTNPVQIGGDSTYGQYFQGLISNVRIYNMALSQSAIQTDMNTAIGSPMGTKPLAIGSTFTAVSSTGNLPAAYGTTLLFNNTTPVPSGSTVQIKLELTDASSANVSSSSILVTAAGLMDSNGNSIPMQSENNANNLFTYDTSLGGYTFDLGTKGLTSGTYTLYYKAGNDPTLHSLTFVVG